MTRLIIVTITVAVTLAAARVFPAAPVSFNNCTVRGEEWRQCGGCDATCEDRENEGCDRMCGHGRCLCKNGLFRSKDGQCITESDCDSALDLSPSRPKPQQCKKNQEWDECASACPAKCGEPKPIFCTRECDGAKCVCKEGFYLNNEGECVTRAECDAPLSPSRPKPHQCKKNEVWKDCPSQCLAKCGEPDPIGCVLMCGSPKCVCEKGFYLNKEGECVTRAECDAQKCKKNQIFNTCSDLCPQAKCGEYGPRICTKLGGCGDPKCECKEGFYLNNERECVTRAECDQDRIVFPDDRIIFPE